MHKKTVTVFGRKKAQNTTLHGEAHIPLICPQPNIEHRYLNMLTSKIDKVSQFLEFPLSFHM